MPGIEHFLINPFLQATKRSAGRTATLGRYTDAALYEASDNPDVAVLYNKYHPVWEAFQVLHSDRGAVQGKSVGKTDGLNKALARLSDDIKDWAFAIETVYRRGTPGYIKLLPRGRAPFRDGKTVTRIAAVHALSLALQDEPALATLRVTVEDAYAELDNIINAAEGAKSSKGVTRDQLERARVQLCEALYAVLGGVIHLYPNNERRVKHFFDIATMHRHRHRKHATGPETHPH